ncbi:MAG: Ig-like domain-containing protein [Terriglobales bacterium]
MLTALLGIVLVSASSGQVSLVTGRADNQRSGANLNETLLTPSNINKNSFGLLFNYPIDYQALAQPLYVQNVNINGQGVLHNVVYVATMADSVFAFDADSNAGSNSAPLWSVNFTDPANGVTLASGVNLPCSGGQTTGFTEEGIAGTPTIDSNTGTMYLVAKTVENGVVRHRLHALDITSGAEKYGGPILISATSVSNQEQVTVFNSLHQLNRPGLLLLNGTVYIAFGSNSCNDDNSGWVLAYDETSLAQTAVFNTSPDHGLTSIWQTGNGIAADENNNIFVETAESCTSCYNIPQGGQTYSNSVLKLDPTYLTVGDYFTPWDVAFLNANDLDLSSTGVLILPDQDGPYVHELVAAGKQGFVYVLDRDNMGMYSSSGNDSQIIQEFPLIPGETSAQKKDVLFSSPAYWNNTVYFEPDASPLLAFPLSGGTLGSPITTAQSYTGAHSPSISANGSTNGILWAISGNNLYAFNATTMAMLYNSNQNKARDQLPTVAHFATQTVANGKVYVATRTTLQVYGLFQSLMLVGGNSQSAQILTALPAPLQLQVIDPYSGAGIPNVTVTFSDGGKGGVFDPASVLSDANGNVSTIYTLPKITGTYTITASSTLAGSLTFTETALPGPPTKVVIATGNKQSGQAGSILPSQLKVKVEDAYSNGVPGITVTFVDNSHAGTLIPTTAVSNASGFAQVSYQLPNADGTYKLTASAPGVKTTALFTEYATGTAPAALVVVSGNNQTAPVNSALPQSLVVQVNDASGNPVAGVSVVFSATSGTVTGSPATSNSSGTVSVNYTTGSSVGAVTISAAVNALNTQFSANVGAGAPASVTVSGGANQSGTAGTTLPQLLSAVVADQYGNPVSGVAVTFSDGGAGGSFSYANPVTTNSAGTASQYYTLPPVAGTISVNATAAGVTNPAVFAESSFPGPPAIASVSSGNNQSATIATQLPQPLTVLVTDRFGNPIQNVSVTFSDNGAGGTFYNPNPGLTGASGTVSQTYLLPSTAGTITITATANGVNTPAVFTENSTAGNAVNIAITRGNNQFAPAGTQLPQNLVVLVTDQYGNPVAGVSVAFSDNGAGGTFANPNPGVTDNTGSATQMYTLPPTPGTVYISSSAAGVANPAIFTETGQ